jgi:Flp pilus assembly protein TadG
LGQRILLFSLLPHSRPRRRIPLLLRRTSQSHDRNHAKGRHGQSLVEFAFAVPVLLLLLLGTIDLGQMFFDYIQLRNAVREGASYGAHYPTDNSGIEAWVKGHGSRLTTGTTVTVALSGNYTTAGGTGTVKVTGSRTFTPITTSFLQSYFGIKPFTMQSSSSARILS